MVQGTRLTMAVGGWAEQDVVTANPVPPPPFCPRNPGRDPPPAARRKGVVWQLRERN
jgi:hypothetical protein